MNLPFDPASPPVCDLCRQAPAALQLMEQRGTETRKISICASCAAQRGIQQQNGQITFNLPSLMAAMAAVHAPGERPASDACPGCGLTAAQFQETGRLGCARCFEVFEALVSQVVKRAQAGTSHRGLAPQRLGPALERAHLEELKRRLKEAVKAEKYEEAARLRDRIREAERNA